MAFLFQKKVTVETGPPTYKTGQIFAAAEKGDVKEIERCLQLGANIEEEDDRKNRHGWTALNWAVAGGHVAAVEFLIARNANVNHLTRQGGFALYSAAYKGDKAMVELLLKNGAIKSRNFMRKTPAEWAKERGHKEVAALLESWVEGPVPPMPSVGQALVMVKDALVASIVPGAAPAQQQLSVQSAVPSAAQPVVSSGASLT